MDKLLITGGTPLNGVVPISGAKNAALPLLASSLLLTKPTRFRCAPHLQDMRTMIRLLSHIGPQLEHTTDGCVNVSSSLAHTFSAPYHLVKTMRASIVVLGPLLARYGKADVSLPGGCAIGSRPVDLHLQALRQLGARIHIKRGCIHARSRGRLRGANIVFEKTTVTGTENLMMAAVLAEGVTRIHNAAREPEVTDLGQFLNQAGAKIHGLGTDVLEIEGVPQLHGGEHSIVADRIEAGTYLIAGAVTGGKVRVTGICPEILTSFLNKLSETGVSLSTGEDWVELDAREKPLKAVNVSTAPYPGIATDMQAQFMTLNLIAEGTSTVKENIFENRFMHVAELRRMGADIHLEGQMAVCHGKTRLIGAPVMATDLRASASLVLAGLAAQGDTLIDRVYHLDRGYEALEQKLTQLGARVRRVRS